MFNGVKEFNKYSSNGIELCISLYYFIRVYDIKVVGVSAPVGWCVNSE